MPFLLGGMPASYSKLCVIVQYYSQHTVAVTAREKARPSHEKYETTHRYLKKIVSLDHSINFRSDSDFCSATVPDLPLVGTGSACSGRCGYTNVAVDGDSSWRPSKPIPMI